MMPMQTALQDDNAATLAQEPTPALVPVYDAIIETLRKAQTVFMTVHVNPDGDTLGSMLGLAHVLKKHFPNITTLHTAMEGKKPDILEFMPGMDTVLQAEVHEPQYLPHYDVSLSFDCGAKHRLGVNGLVFDRATTRVNIDHHVSNELFGDLNVVETHMSASGQVVAHLIDRMGLPIEADSATCLYTAVMTDTGNFRYSNSTPAVFRLAARLVEAGAQGHAIYQTVYENSPYEQSRLLATLVLNARFDLNNQVVWGVITPQMLQEFQALEEYTEGGVELLRQIKGVKAAAVIKECAAGHVKISFRSSDPALNVSAFAAKFGGGGHVLASGCSLQTTAQEAEATVIPQLVQYVRESLA